MNKFVRYLIVTAGACTIMGFGLIMAGRILGGEPGFWIRSDGFHTNQDMRHDRAGQIATLEKTEMEPFESINIQVDFNHITVKPSDDGRYYLECRLFTRKNKPEYDVKDGVLNLTCIMEPDSYASYGTSGFFIVNTDSVNQNGEVTVYVPNDIPMDLVKLYSNDGDVAYEGPEAKTLDFTSKYGGIQLKSPKAENAYLTLSDGTVSLDGGSFTTLNLTNKYGNTTLNRITASRIDIKASDGNLTMKEIIAGSLTTENKYGKTVLDSVTADSLMMDQNDGDCTIRNADINSGCFENKFGDITLELTGLEADYNYNLKMKYGKIRLNGQTYDEEDYHKNNGASKNIRTDSNDGNVRILTR